MPKKLTDQDRLLKFAFAASPEQLENAIGIFKAALSAKKGVSPRTRTSKPAKDTKVPEATKTAGGSSEG